MKSELPMGFAVDEGFSNQISEGGREGGKRERHLCRISGRESGGDIAVTAYRKESWAQSCEMLSGKKQELWNSR